MFQDIFILAELAFMAVCGARCAKRAFGIKVYGVALAVGLPLGLAIFGLITNALRPILPPGASTIGGAVGLLLFALSFTIRRRLHRPTQELPPPDAPEPFGRYTLLGIGLVSLLALIALRLGQLSALSPDFCLKYPFFRALLLEGNNLQAPFFPAQTYAGSLPYAVLVASLSLTVHGDVLRTEWILQAVLLLDAIVMCALSMRFFLRRALPAALATALLFGSALTPSFANQTTICYADLLSAAVVTVLFNCYLTLVRYNRQHKETPPLAGLTVGALTMFSALIYPLLTLLLWLGLVALGILYALRRNANALVLGRSALVITLYTALWGSTQLLCWQQTAALWHQGCLSLPHLSSHLFQITMPTNAFEVTAGSSVSLFSRPSLLWHAPVFFLGWPLVVWVIWRRSRKGAILWASAVFFFIWPGLVEGAINTWRCELLSDSLMAILLGYALGDAYQLWSRQRSAWTAKLQRLTLGLALLVLTAGFWSSIIAVYRNYPCPTERVSHLLLPWYPDTAHWLAQVPQLELPPGSAEMADFLWHEQERPLRTLIVPPNLAECSWAGLALWAGQSGTLPVGFVAPRQDWKSCGLQGSLTDIYSGFSCTNNALPAPGTLAFLQQPRHDVLLGLGAELIVCSSLSKQEADHAKLHLWHSTEPAHLSAYRLDNDFPWQRQLLPYPNPGISITVSAAPALEKRSGGVAYRAKLHANVPLHGWLWPQWQDADTSAPLTLFIKGKEAEVPLVFPYQAGDHKVSWLYCPQDKLTAETDSAAPLTATDDADNGSVPACDPYAPLTVERLTGTTELPQQFATTLEQNLRLVKVEQLAPRAGIAVLKNAGTTPLDCGSDLRLRWQVWSPTKHGYIQTMHRQETVLPLPLKPGTSITVRWQCPFDVSSQDRLDFSVSPRYGELLPVIRL